MVVAKPTMVQDERRVTLITWGPMAGGDTGDFANIGDLAYWTVQAVGDATSVVLQGSNDGVTPAQMGAGATTLTIASGTSPVLEPLIHPSYVKIITVTGGTSTKVFLSGFKLKG